jgi:hypothetical protein
VTWGPSLPIPDLCVPSCPCSQTAWWQASLAHCEARLGPICQGQSAVACTVSANEGCFKVQRCAWGSPSVTQDGEKKFRGSLDPSALEKNDIVTVPEGRPWDVVKNTGPSQGSSPLGHILSEQTPPLFCASVSSSVKWE